MPIISKQRILVIILFLFSILINQYYGNKGVFPVDSFSHFDTGFRILLGEHPFKNYWIVSGPIVDYLQAIFFYIFGVSWQSYVLHASIINAIISVATFLILLNFKLNLYFSFFYSLLFSILAYPTSGTPFVDHHSAFFSLLGIYSLILGIKHDKKIYWILLPIFFVMAFLSKQVPSSYVILSTFLVLIFFTFFTKKYYWIKYSLLSFLIFIILILVLGKIQEIPLSSFIDQYIFYPQSIGSLRFENLNFTFRGAIDHFKFIYIALFPLLFINLKRILFEKKYFKNKDFYYFLSLFLFTFSLIFHQILTKNQTFIFFTIPLLFAFSHISFHHHKPNIRNFLIIFSITMCVFASLKYHLRFNENRKFHELNYVDFNLSSYAKKIDKLFIGLRWITPEYKNSSKKEIDELKKIKLHLINDARTKMVMTNYSFFSAILNENIFSPSRWFIADGTDYPLKGNKYFSNYKDLLIRSINNNNITVIYTIHPVDKSFIYAYVSKNCFIEKKITKLLNSYEIKECEEINN